MADQRRAWQRLMGPVWRRIRLLVSRGVLKLVDDSLKLQSVQVALLGGAPAWAERFQQYGYTSHPHPGAEAVVAAVGGARAHLVALTIDDRRYRLVGLAQGEVAIYDDQGQKVHLTRDGIVIDGVGKPVNFVNCPDVYMDGNLHVAGEVKDHTSTMQAMRDTYNDHDHDGDSGGTTGKPKQEMG
ncbi:phage baseplate assembly protein V [Billgrantia ethanolica]|uniref:Phage baseplate assembly protein n=1 Tax=Billgrantia ethanolica TaxID=2733486 RepID=A0ABS9A5Z2_9GAMM|nr:phage baseplate assembly protein V [Halomonas ethanolica]MCE8004216.1 phage baseplate assembly protein [Halomonas ethanolica]